MRPLHLLLPFTLFAAAFAQQDPAKPNPTPTAPRPQGALPPGVKPMSDAERAELKRQSDAKMAAMKAAAQADAAKAEAAKLAAAKAAGQVPDKAPEQAPPNKLPTQPPGPVKGTETWFQVADKSVDVPAGETEAEVTFAFSNPTGKDIDWRQLNGSCQCTNARIRVGGRTYELKPKPYQLVELKGEKGEVREPVSGIPVRSGESGEVEVHMDTHGLAGSKLVTVDIHTTDPGMPMGRLQMTARGQMPFTLTPNQIELGNMTWGQKREFSVKLTSPQPDFEILGSDPLPKELTATWTKGTDNGKTVWTITGAYGPIESGEATGCNVYLRTNIKGGDQILLKVLAVVKPPLTVTPGLLTLGIIRRGKPRIEKITLTPTEGTEFAVSAVRLEGSSVDAKFVTTRVGKDGKSVVVEVEIAAEVPAGLVSGDLVLDLTHPTVKSQKVRFNGYAR